MEQAAHRANCRSVGFLISQLCDAIAKAHLILQQTKAHPIDAMKEIEAMFEEFTQWERHGEE